MMRSLLVLGLSFVTFTSHADNRKWRPLCPVAHPEYDKIVGQLEQFRARLQGENRCPDMVQSLESLQKIVGSDKRKWVAELYGKSVEVLNGATTKKNELTVDEVKGVQAYSDSVAVTVSDLVTLVQHRQECLNPQDKASLFGTLATATQEVTRVVSAVSGPYNAPVALVGSAVSSLMKGIFHFIENQRRSNFNISETRRTFAKNICVYSELETQVNYYARPYETLAVLNNIRQEMDTKITDITGACTDCAEYYRLNNSEPAFEQILALTTKDLPAVVNEATATPMMAWSACSTVSTMVTSEDGAVANLQNQFSVMIGTAPETSRLRTIKGMLALIQRAAPKSEACMVKDTTEISVKTIRTAALIGQLVASMREFVRDYKRFLIEKADLYFLDGYPNGTYIASSIVKRQWSLDEITKLQSMVGPGSSGALYEVSLVQQGIEQRLFGEMLPGFLKWHMEEGSKSYKRFWKAFKPWEEGVLRRVTVAATAKGLTAPKDLNETLTLIKEKNGLLELNVAEEYSHIRRTLTSVIQASYIFLDLRDFCAYLVKSGHYSGRVSEYCAIYGPLINSSSLEGSANPLDPFEGSLSDEAREQLAAAEKLGKALVDLFGFLSWAQRTLGVDGSYMHELVNHIERWRNDPNRFRSRAEGPVATPTPASN